MARLRRTARKSVPGGPYHVVGFQMPGQTYDMLLHEDKQRETRLFTGNSENLAMSVKPYNTAKPQNKVVTSGRKGGDTSLVSHHLVLIMATIKKGKPNLHEKVMPGLIIRMANPLYIQILKNGPFTPMVRVEESTYGDMVIPAHYAPKYPAEYTEPEKEKVSLDSGLQLILIESLDNIMYNNIVNCDTAKQIWEKIKILCAGTEEVKSNQRRILISQYEGFMAKPKESITDVFKRFNKLINDLQLHEKYYEVKEVNLKFLLTLLDHLEL
ncbi:hypothetical protein AgCh_039463 [Apium graveolens]